MSKYIAIDFDGTVVTHAYPTVGRSIEAEPVLLELVDAGHRLILHTMRSGAELVDAEVWFQQRGIQIWNVNRNPDQDHWTSSPKIWANVYIDDCAIGVPLKQEIPGERPFVDWDRVRGLLVEMGLLPQGK